MLDQAAQASSVAKRVMWLGLDPAEYGTHSMRRTKATLVHHRTKNLRAVELLLGHQKSSQLSDTLVLRSTMLLSYMNRPRFELRKRTRLIGGG